MSALIYMQLALIKLDILSFSAPCFLLAITIQKYGERITLFSLMGKVLPTNLKHLLRPKQVLCSILMPFKSLL